MTMSRIARLDWHSPLIRGGFETSRGTRGIGRDVRRTYLRFFWMEDGGSVGSMFM
jgi:hypothetical protein